MPRTQQVWYLNKLPQKNMRISSKLHEPLEFAYLTTMTLCFLFSKIFNIRANKHETYLKL